VEIGAKAISAIQATDIVRFFDLAAVVEVKDPCLKFCKERPQQMVSHQINGLLSVAREDLLRAT
jgi:hypothetical protein